ncbi:MAG: histidine kinase [Actinomycetota bacterium]
MWERLRTNTSPDSPMMRAELAYAVVVALVVVAFLAESVEADDALPTVTVVMAIVGCVALLARRRFPVTVMAVAIAGRLLVISEAGSGLVMLPIVAVAVYNVARHGDRRRGLLVAGAGAGAMALVAAWLGDDGLLVELLEEGALAFLPIAVADALRTREDRVNDLVEAEAAARVQAERLRIARDLHDVVAHGLSVIAIQSGVASRLLGDDHPQASEALAAINATGRSSLEDLRGMVGALRSTDLDSVHPTPADPDDLDDVIGPARAAGVDVRLAQSGQFPDDVGDALVVATHRILQEALMNVARHAGAVRADVELAHRDAGLRLTVTNGIAHQVRTPVASTGVGIIGMRERAESVGGELVAVATDEGGFVVTADLPYPGRPG